MKDLKCDLESLYTESINCDVNLRVETEIIPVHKAILSARSPVFRAMFSHDIKENASGFIDINDMDMKTLRLVLMYMYTNTLQDLDGTNVQKLYMAADKYELSSLKEQCSSYMLNYITAENAGEILAFADMIKDDHLKSCVQEYVVHYDEEVFKTAAWKTFIKSCPPLAAETMLLKYLKTNKF
ncbi:speckle-type POZ protein [Caerostris extrusa]|uniref:Speckle-type POZ protein n=1 Tax=Caerostris extrusa TaxID=172846 RepID=A0AAV4NMJ1_CAEEX|nr:speckle-type POZ protein [Caerostris extrusa]